MRGFSDIAAKLGISLLCAVALAAADSTGVGPAPSSHSAPKAKYEALFSDILKTLPDQSRAKVDSAGVAARGKNKPERPGTKADAKASESAGKGADREHEKLESLPPGVKERVEKAISDMEARKAERKAELKDLGK